MKTLQKITTVIILLLGAITIVRSFYPQTEIGKKIGKLTDNIQRVKENRDDVLGDEVIKDKNVISQKKVAEQLKRLPGQIIQQEIVKETIEKVNQVVIEETEKIKEMPKEQLEAVKKEIKKKICQEICGEWMNEN